MKTYWENSEVERMNMKCEEVQALIDIELMTKGIIKVNPPNFKEIKSLDQFEKIIYYEVSGILFKTMEQASAFVQLNPLKEGYDYYGAGYDFKYAECADNSIKTVRLFKADDIKINQAVFKWNKTAKEYNEAEEKKYKKELETMDAATSPVWDDWHEKQATRHKCERINETYQDYLKMTEGNEHLARDFLTKIYSESEIKLAEELKQASA